MAAELTRDEERSSLAPFKPAFTPSSSDESPTVQSIISALSLNPHIEGGYYAVTDVCDSTIPSPYPSAPLSQRTIDLVDSLSPDFDYSLRRLSTTIFYYLTPNRPQGFFHRNRSRIIHALHRGRGRYVLIHPEGRVESFIVGHDIQRGERLQWVVEGDVWKASFLLDTEDGSQDDNEGLLVSETVTPGFEYADHEFLSHEQLVKLLPKAKAEAIEWLVRD